MPEIVPEQLRELIVRNNNVTIERCAQVAEEWFREHGYDLRHLEVAAAIRKLKEPLPLDPNIVYPGKPGNDTFPEE